MTSQLELLAEADRRGILTGPKKELFDEAKRRGLVGGRQMEMPPSRAGEAVDQVAEDLPALDMAVSRGTFGTVPLPVSAGMALGEILGSKTGRIGIGKSLNDYRENLIRFGQTAGEMVGVLGPNDRAQMEKQLGSNDDADRAFAKAQPTADLAGGMVADAAMTAWVPGSVGRGVLGAVSGAALGGATVLAGTGVDESPWANFGIGAALGAAAPLIGAAVGKVVNRLTTKPIQVINPTTRQFTPEAMQALEKAGTTPEQFVDEVALSLREKGATKEMLERFNLFKELGLEPTLPQVTRKNSDFLLQQEFRKDSNALTTHLANQDKILGQHMDRMITNAGGQAVDNIDAGILLSRTIFDRVNEVDAGIDDAYKAARLQANKAKIVSVPRLAAKLRAFAKDDNATNGLISSVVGDLEQRGLLSEMSAKGRKGSVELVEEVRKTINSLSGENPQARSRVARQLKEALDDDVAAAVGDDVFKPARQMKAQFERSLERARTTRRDAGKDTLLEMMIDNRSSPDQLVDAVMRKSTRSEDVSHLRNFLESGSPEQVQAGKQAIAEVKTAILRDVYKKATAGNGGLTEEMTLEFSGPKFKKALDSIGNQKLTALFDGEELSLLGKLSRVGELRVPTPMTQLGGGPSSAGMLASAGKDAMALMDVGDPQTSAFARLTGAAFRRVRQGAVERRLLNVESQLQKAIPDRIPADQL